MSSGLELSKFSIGVGDRFAHQARAQLAACIEASARGVEVIPVWNKSNREHNIIGSDPASTRAAADAAVTQMRWISPITAMPITSTNRRSSDLLLRAISTPSMLPT